jgi:hypothetical protein
MKDKSLKLREVPNRPGKNSSEPDYFYSYEVSVSPKLIKELGWKKGQELKASVKNDKLVIEKE